MNSVYDAGNLAHEMLMNDNFKKAIFINTKVIQKSISAHTTSILDSIIYKNVEERTSNNMFNIDLQEIKLFDSIIYVDREHNPIDVNYL